MIIRTTTSAFYYPVWRFQATNLVRETRRVRYVRGFLQIAARHAEILKP
jgi:hypothetical protein